MSYNSNGLEDKKLAMDRAINDMINREGAEVPRGPKPEPVASNSTAIGILKQEIEATQAAYSFANTQVRTLEQALEQAKESRKTLNRQESRQVKTMLTIARADGMTDEQIQALNHEMNQDCEESECQDCCEEFHGHEFDSSEGGYCACGHHYTE